MPDKTPSSSSSSAHPESKYWFARHSKSIIFLILTLAVVGLRRLRARPERAATVPTALPPGAQSAPALAEDNSVEKKMQAQLGSQAEVQARLEAEALQAIKSPTPSTNKKDVLSKYLRESLKKDPVVQVQILRTWLNEKA